MPDLSLLSQKRLLVLAKLFLRAGEFVLLKGSPLAYTRVRDPRECAVTMVVANLNMCDSENLSRPIMMFRRI
jgi:hypothetical protein